MELFEKTILTQVIFSVSQTQNLFNNFDIKLLPLSYSTIWRASIVPFPTTVTSSMIIGPLDMKVGFNSVKMAPSAGSLISDGLRRSR